MNAPQERREFYFSPEVGRSLDYEGSGTPASVVEQVKVFGRGEFVITDYRLTPPAQGERASFVSVVFEACLVWNTTQGTTALFTRSPQRTQRDAPRLIR